MNDIYSPTTSPTLLELLRDPGNEAAWCRFVDLYAPLIDARCHGAGLQPADVDEVRSRVLAGLVSALREFRYDPARRFRGYLAAAVNNALRTWWRERATRPGTVGTGGSSAARLLDQAELPPDVVPLADELDDRLSEALAQVQRVLERVRGMVEPDTWQAYWQTAIEARHPAEVARELGKSIAAVYVAKSRVTKLLRAEGQRLLDASDAEPG